MIYTLKYWLNNHLMTQYAILKLIILIVHGLMLPDVYPSEILAQEDKHKYMHYIIACGSKN